MNFAFRETESVAGQLSEGLGFAKTNRQRPGASKEELMSALVLAAADVTLFGIAWAVAASLLTITTDAPFAAQVPLLLVLPLLMLMSAIQGLYPGYGLGRPERLRRRWSTAASFFALLATMCVLMPVAGISGALVMLVGLTYIGVVPLAEEIARLVLKKRGLWGKKVILTGDVAQVGAYTLALKNAPDLGLVPVAPGTANARLMQVAGLPAAEDIGLQGLLPVPAQSQFVQPYKALKRGIDLAIGLVAGLCALPLIGVFGAAIYAIDKGPIFYAQPRLGLHGRIVKTWKLRSMYQDSQERFDKHLAENIDAASEWRQFFKLKRDPRILPKVGAFMRIYSIDELPQIWNILCGELSVVGPRIFPEYHMKAFSPEFQKLRLSVQPGLTGLWQTSVRSEGDLVQQEALDRAYIRNWSMWLDLDLIYRTFGAVLGAKGAV